MILKDSCERTMKMNNNQGWVNMAGGPPPNNSIIDYSGSHDTLTIKYNATLLPPVPQNPPWYV